MNGPIHATLMLGLVAVTALVMINSLTTEVFADTETKHHTFGNPNHGDLEFTIHEGDHEDIARVAIRFEANPIAAGSLYPTIVRIDTTASLKPDLQGAQKFTCIESDGVGKTRCTPILPVPVTTTFDYDRVMCREHNSSTIGGPIGFIYDPTARNYLPPYNSDGTPADPTHPFNDLDGGCPVKHLGFYGHETKYLSFSAGHDADKNDHRIPIRVQTYGGPHPDRDHTASVTTVFTIWLNIIDDDKNKSATEAYNEYRISGFVPHNSSPQLAEINEPPSKVQIIGMGDGRMTLQWDNTYEHLWYLDAVNGAGVVRIDGITDGSYEFTGLSKWDVITLGVCKGPTCADRLDITTVDYIESEYTPLGMAAISVSDITNDSATISWKPVEHADQYDVHYWPLEFPSEWNMPSSEDPRDYYTSFTTASVTNILSGLESGISYGVQAYPMEVIDDTWHVYDEFASPIIGFTTINGTTSIPVPQTPPQTDATPPVITLYGNHTITIPYNGVYTEPGATCTDDVDGAILLDITGTVDTSTSGDHTITYSCQDSAGNAAAVYRTVTVGFETAQSQSDVVPDTTRPIITLNGAAQVNLTVGDTYVDAGATCTDDTDGAISVSDDSANVDTQTPNSYTITYSCTDTSGNAATPVHRTVTVAEPQAPTTVDAALIATVQSYADETHHGADHVDRWYRVLAAFDAITPMTVSEAQGYVDKGWNRWTPIVAELQKSTASQVVIDDVISYAAETHHGADHVNRWYRVLAAFDAIDTMSVSEAQGYADKGWDRWTPIVAALKTLQ